MTSARSWAHRRRWPIVISTLSLALGLAYLFFWNPVVHHIPDWAVADDLWGIFRGAHYVGWGDIGGVYSGQTGVVAFPGMEILLAPIAMLSDHLSLTESFGFWIVTRPSAALMVVPAELVLGSTVLFASDALAERLGVDSRRRRLLCLWVAVMAWPTVAVWGHAEDLLAVALAMWAMTAVLDGSWSAAGWLFGFGIALQPLVALLLPLFIAATPLGMRLWFAVRASALSVVLVGAALLTAPSATLRTILDQPTPPSMNHPTPWVAVAPKVNPVMAFADHVSRAATVIAFVGHSVIVPATEVPKPVVYVAGGAGRLIDVVLVIAIGVFVVRRPQTPMGLLWLAAAVLASRCFFEPVMTPYYLAPPLIVCLIVASRQPPKRFWACVALALEVTVFSYHHLGPWSWWLPVVASLSGILFLSHPGSGERRTSPTESETEGAEGFGPAENSIDGTEAVDLASVGVH